MPLYDQGGKRIIGADDTIQVPKQLITEINTRTAARKAINDAFVNHKRTCVIGGRHGEPCAHMSVMRNMEHEAVRLGNELHVLMAKLLMTLGVETGQPDETTEPTNLMEMPTKPGSNPS